MVGREMFVQSCAALPSLDQHEPVWIVEVTMKCEGDATGLGMRWRDDRSNERLGLRGFPSAAVKMAMTTTSDITSWSSVVQ